MDLIARSRSEGKNGVGSSTRRTVLRATAAAGTLPALPVGSVVGATRGTPGSGTASVSQDEYPDWPDEVENANLGTFVDARGEDEVRIEVGADDDGLAFDPTKLWIDPDTTVIWEWAGRGGAHNVAHVDGPGTGIESDITDEEGFTYEFEFTAEHGGITHYACEPHTGVGMHGGVAVGDDVPVTDEERSTDDERDDVDDGADGANDADDGANDGANDEPAEEMQDEEAAEDDASGFGVVGAVSALGGVAYLLKGRVERSSGE